MIPELVITISGIRTNVRQIKDSVQFCDAPYPIIANFPGCLHQNPFLRTSVTSVY